MQVCRLAMQGLLQVCCKLKLLSGMVLRARTEKQLKKNSLESAKKHAVYHFKGNFCFRGVLIVITVSLNSY